MSEQFASAKMMLGRNLRDRGRYDEASAYFQEAIASDPDDAEAFFELARTQYLMDGKGEAALATVERAVQLEPDAFHLYALKSLILSKLRRNREAVSEAERAQGLAPDHPFPLRAKAQALMGMEKWSAAEEALRQTLQLDPDDDFAANLLATTLRVQNKRWEAEQTVEQLLSEDPESPHAHFNAGWSALQRGDHRKAEEHFREALRLDAQFDGARQGLIESFKARSPIYRRHLAWCFWMQQHSGATRWAIIIGLLVGVRIGSTLLEKVHPLAALALGVAYGLFVFYGWLASGIGHFLILLDRRARMALKKPEILEGIFVGGALSVGLGLLVGGILGGVPFVTTAGAFMMLSAMPASLTFTNESTAGRLVFGGMTALIWVAIPAAAILTGLSGSIITGAVVLALLCTWIGQIPQLRNGREA